MPRIPAIAVVAATGSVIGLGEAHGQRSDRSGKEVVEATCASCHDQSGEHWAEPINKATLPAVRCGAQVVHMQCAMCHQTGEGGAPKIGDKVAWIPRLTEGIDAAVRSAIRGHGGMPARGGLANLTDQEIRSAVIYMFNPVSIATVPAPATPAVVRDGMHKVVGTMDLYLGISSAGSVRVQRQAGFETQQMHGSIPRGTDYHHLNVSLVDRKTSTEITNATVEVTVEDPIMGGETKALDTMKLNDAISYGQYFRMPGKDPYRITVHNTKPGATHPVSAEFDFKHY